MDKDVKSFAIRMLRRASYRWTPRQQAYKNAKVEYGKYKCAECKGIFRAKDVEKDHKIPVVSPTTGWTNFDDFIERLFCPKEGYQVLCRTDHEKKSLAEGQIRTKQRRKKKASVEFDSRLDKMLVKKK